MCILVVSEITGYPLVDLTQRHPSLRGAIDCKDNQGSIGIRWLFVDIFVVVGVDGVQVSIEINRNRWRLSGTFGARFGFCMSVVSGRSWSSHQPIDGR